MRKDKHEIDFTQGKMLKNIFSYALPIILNGWLQTLFNVVDMIVVGRYVGNEALAAVGSTSSLINLIVQLFAGLSTGATILVSQSFGARDEQKMSRASHTTMAVSIVGGILFAIIGIVTARPMLILMKSPADVIDLSTMYVQVYFAGIPFVFLQSFTSGIMRAYGDNKRPLYFMALSGVLNVVLNLIAVVWLGWSVAGVAVATFISEGVAAVLNLYCLLRVDNACRITLKKIRFHKKEFLDILRFGIPAGVQSSVFSATNIFLQTAVNSFGSATMAAFGAVNYPANALSSVSNGFGTAASTLCAQNYGAKKKDRILSGWKQCMSGVGVVLLVMGLTFSWTMPYIMCLFTKDPDTIEIGSRIIWYYVPFWFIGGLMSTAGCAMRGVGHSAASMWVTILGTCVFRVLWIFLVFASYPTLKVLFASYPSAWFITGVMQVPLFLYFVKKLDFSTDDLSKRTC